MKTTVLILISLCVVQSAAFAGMGDVGNIRMRPRTIEAKIPKSTRKPEPEQTHVVKQKQILSCLRDMAHKKDFGKYRTSAVQLVKWLYQDGKQWTTDEQLLDKAVSTCRLGFSYPFIDSVSDSPKVNELATSLISDLENPKHECYQKGVKVILSPVVSVGAGGTLLKCFGTDGKERRYLGVKGIIGAGLGAMATIGRNNYSSSDFECGEIFAHGHENEVNSILVGGDTIDGVFINMQEVEGSKSVGLHMGFAGREYASGVRIGNGPESWDRLMRYTLGEKPF